VKILHDIIICEETASEYLPYASTAAKIMQNPAFQNPKDWLSKCVGNLATQLALKCCFLNGSFCQVSDIGLQINILLSNFDVLTSVKLVLELHSDAQ
jgi:hypothetical protein